MLPNAPELLTPLADIWIEQGEFDRAEEAIRELEARKDSAPRVNYLRGRTLMKRGRWNEAVAVLDALRADTVALPGLTPQLNLLLASCYERRGDYEAQMESLRRAWPPTPITSPRGSPWPTLFSTAGGQTMRSRNTRPRRNRLSRGPASGVPPLAFA